MYSQYCEIAMQVMSVNTRSHFVWYGILLSSGWIVIEDCWCTKVEQHPAWSMLDQFECGDSAADRIIGGEDAALGQFPWIARLGYKMFDEPNQTSWMCGGVLITDRHVVSAAHCLHINPEDGYELSKVRLGEHDTTTNPDCELSVCAPLVQDFTVKKVTIHESFNTPAFHNDLGIIELDKPVQLNDYVAPVCLPRDPQSDLKLGELITVAGWGKVNMSTEERSNILQVVALPIVPCSPFGGFKPAPSVICAGAQRNKDACGGDSGGPLTKVFDSPDGPKNFLMGVVSFGPTICGIKKPGVYTSVYYFLKWILDKLI